MTSQDTTKIFSLIASAIACTISAAIWLDSQHASVESHWGAAKKEVLEEITKSLEETIKWRETINKEIEIIKRDNASILTLLKYNCLGRERNLVEHNQKPRPQKMGPNLPQ